MLLFYLINITLANDPIHTALLYGSYKQGYYYVNVFVGTPPQRQTLIVDTASSITTFPCSDCISCGSHMIPSFSLQDTTTSSVIACNSDIGLSKCRNCDNSGKCVFGINYAEGSSLQGYYRQDYMIFGDELLDMYNDTNKKQLVEEIQTYSVFGCTTRETNLFVNQEANGILGLSPGTNSTSQLPNIVNYIEQQEKNLGMQNLFTLCIGRVNGYMSIGQYNTDRHIPNTPIHIVNYHNFDGGEFYGIDLQQIMINKMPLQINLKKLQIFIDSGATLIYAPSTIVDEFRDKFECPDCEMKIQNGLKCYSNTKNQQYIEFAAQFPSFFFQIDEYFTLDWTPEEYLVQESGYFCLPIIEFNQEPQRLILGQVWMRNWDIAFDRTNQLLHFASSNCSHNSTVYHNFTEEELILLEYDLNHTRVNYKNYTDNNYQPSTQIEKFWTEFFAMTIIICLLIILIVVLKLIFKKLSSYNKIPFHDELQNEDHVELQIQ